MLRKPSHFGSYDAPGGIVCTALASIGATGGITGSCMRPFCRRPTPFSGGNEDALGIYPVPASRALLHSSRGRDSP